MSDNSRGALQSAQLVHIHIPSVFTVVLCGHRSLSPLHRRGDRGPTEPSRLPRLAGGRWRNRRPLPIPGSLGWRLSLTTPRASSSSPEEVLGKTGDQQIFRQFCFSPLPPPDPVPSK